MHFEGLTGGAVPVPRRCRDTVSESPPLRRRHHTTKDDINTTKDDMIDHFTRSTLRADASRPYRAALCPRAQAARLTSSGVALGALLGATAAYWLWFGLTQRSVVGDEGISLLAAQGVLDHGYPRLPSGFLYNRAYLPTYVLAASLALGGWNDLAIMLPSLIMALVSIWITSRIGATVLGRPLVGLAAAFGLALLQSQTFYATSARMYMSLQAFSIVATYGAWRGFVKGELAFKGVTAVAIAGAILSHEQGGTLLVAVPIGLLVTRTMQGPSRPPLRTSAVLLGLVLLWAAFYAATVYEPAARMPAVSAHSGVDADHAGLNLNITQWLRHAVVAERTLPLGALVLPGLAWLLLGAVRAPHVPAHQGLVFTVSMFLAGAFALVMNINQAHSRFWVMLLPLHALLVCRGGAGVAEWARAAAVSPASRRLMALTCVSWPLIVLGASAAAFGPAVYLAFVREAYGMPPCRTATCSMDIAAEHMKLRDVLAPGDVVVTSNPMVTYYYLGQVDGFLRERRDGARFVPFQHVRDEYFGIPLIDRVSELTALRDSGRRIWIVMDYKVRSYVSRATRDFVTGSFAPFLEGNALSIYVGGSTAAPADAPTRWQHPRRDAP
jgi:hypothetical protein